MVDRRTIQLAEFGDEYRKYMARTWQLAPFVGGLVVGRRLSAPRRTPHLGIWLLLVGVTVIYRTWTPLLFLVVCAPSFYRRARREERALEAVFGAGWHTYAARVPMFVPQGRLGEKQAGARQ